MVALLCVDERLRALKSVDAVTEAPWLEAAVATCHCTLRELRARTYPRGGGVRERRVFKTHAHAARFPASEGWRPDGVLDETARIVVGTRNPKDTCVSLYPVSGKARRGRGL